MCLRISSLQSLDADQDRARTANASSVFRERSQAVRAPSLPVAAMDDVSG